MNFTDKILEKGYVRRIMDCEIKKGRYDCSFNSLNGWLGLTVYHPYEVFTKGGNKVEIDISRFNTYDLVSSPFGINKIPVSEKRIKITIAGDVIYDNKNGVIPDDKIINLL